MKRQLLFVQGPEKTGTSTITGILNCHPEIFILFENYMAQPVITKYGNQLLSRYPEARRFFRTEDDYGVPVEEFFSFLETQEPNYSYQYVGTKVNSLDPEFTQKLRKQKIIFMKRDIKSWLLKESVIKRYRTDLDVVIPAMEFLRYIVQSSAYSHAYHLWMEDMIKKNDEVISGLSDYLKIDLDQHAQEWWKKTSTKEDKDPKSVFRLGHVHHSSKIKPEKLDTEYTIIKQPFWNDVDEIFNKYNRNTFDNKSILHSNIEKDLKKIDDLAKYSPIKFEECYSEALSVRFGFKDQREVYLISEKTSSGSRRNMLKKFLKRMNRIKNIVLGLNKLDKRWFFPMFFYDEYRVAYELIYLLVNLDVYI